MFNLYEYSLLLDKEDKKIEEAVILEDAAAARNLVTVDSDSHDA